MVEKVKKAIEMLYGDVCSVYEKQCIYENGRTRFEDKIVYENIPCRLSVKAYLFGENAGSENKNSLKVRKRAKLFVPPEYEIKPGSRIKVTAQKRESLYGKSGEMSSYASHNEVMIELEKNYA